MARLVARTHAHMSRALLRRVRRSATRTPVLNRALHDRVRVLRLRARSSPFDLLERLLPVHEKPAGAGKRRLKRAPAPLLAAVGLAQTPLFPHRPGVRPSPRPRAAPAGRLRKGPRRRRRARPDRDHRARPGPCMHRARGAARHRQHPASGAHARAAGHSESPGTPSRRASRVAGYSESPGTREDRRCAPCRRSPAHTHRECAPFRPFRPPAAWRPAAAGICFLRSRPQPRARVSGRAHTRWSWRRSRCPRRWCKASGPYTPAHSAPCMCVRMCLSALAHLHARGYRGRARAAPPLSLPMRAPFPQCRIEACEHSGGGGTT